MDDSTPAEKLLITPGTAVWMSHPERITLLEPWPIDTCQVGDVTKAGVALVFADDESVLRRSLDQVTGATRGPAHVWVVHRGGPEGQWVDRVGAVLEEYRLAPDEHLGVDRVWSALRVRPAPGATPSATVPQPAMLRAAATR